MTDSSKFTKIEGMLVYVQVDKPVKAYQAAGADRKPDEFKASIVVTDEDWVDDFEAWCKEVDAKPSIKKVKTAEFEGIYKVAPPADAAKNVWVLTFRKSSEQGKTGNKILPQHEPKVYERNGKTLEDITHTKLVSNGSTGVLEVTTWLRNNNTTSIELKRILVLDLIEYVKDTPDETTADEAFAEYLGGKPAAKPATAPSKPAAKGKAKVEQEDNDSSLPF